MAGSYAAGDDGSGSRRAGTVCADDQPSVCAITRVWGRSKVIGIWIEPQTYPSGKKGFFPKRQRATVLQKGHAWRVRSSERKFSGGGGHRQFSAD